MPSVASGSDFTLAPLASAVPGPWWLLAAILYVAFVLHILLVNAVVGVAFITLAARVRALIRPLPGNGDTASMKEASLRIQASLLPKGVALLVNLAVPALLFVQVLYGAFFYSSSILMALYWIFVMLVVMTAYYGLYVNTATRVLSGNARTFALFLSVLLLAGNAFILVNNATLMQSPSLWQAYAENSGGTLLALADPQVIPRWLHALLSCVAVGGLCIAVPANMHLKSLVREYAPAPAQAHALARVGAGLIWFASATALQLPVGLWFFMALPRELRLLFMGGHSLATVLFAGSLLLLGFALFSAHRRRPSRAAVATVLMVFFMAGMRHILRDAYLGPYLDSTTRPFMAGPFVFFLAALVLTVLLLAVCVRAYRRGSAIPRGLEVEMAGEDAAPVRELASCPEPDTEGKPGPSGAKA